ncbi:hypothetical protein [Nocardioides sp. InS609-2]|uniref:DUF7224 domain-containing protein n=1 Tax=Nocardioides sp. InS609-2 TaxID=2760705 RepID=UPI0020C05236|nr:hypothetical protein [Nocardioides sp. InS609-2]
MSNADFVDPYWLDLSSKSTVSVLFLAPGFSALAAWDAAKWRNLMINAARSWISVFSLIILYVAAATMATFLLTLLALMAQVTPSVGFPRLDVLALGVAVTCAYTAFGFLLGRFLPGLVAAPLAFVVIWGWVAYTPAVQPFWLRNITGNIGSSCCSVDFQLVPLALLAPAVVAASLLVAVMAVLAWPMRPLVWAFSVGIVGAAVALSATMMSDIGADPVQGRTGSQQCVENAGRKFCAWPEHAAELRQTAKNLGNAADALSSAGLDVPSTLRENAKSKDRWSFSLNSGNVDFRAKTLILSQLDELPPPCTDQTQGVWPAGVNFELAGAWLLAVTGTPVTEAAEVSGASLPDLRRLLEEDLESQAQWYESALSAMRSCDPV